MGRFWEQVELVDQLVAQKDLTRVPGNTLFHHGFTHAKTVPNFKCALGKTQRTRAEGEPVVVVHNQHGLAALCEVNGCRKADRSCAHDHYGVTARLRRILVGRAHIGELYGLHLLTGAAQFMKR